MRMITVIHFSNWELKKHLLLN